ncbi:hypothetical protein ACWGBO_34580 [[Kitasatospora] papulosa]
MCTVASHSLSTWRQGLTAQPGDWTLTANGPENLYGTSGSTAVTDVTVPPRCVYPRRDRRPRGLPAGRLGMRGRTGH